MIVKDIIFLKNNNGDWKLDGTRTDWKTLALKAHDEFVKNQDCDEVELEVRITSIFQYKTSSQLGYLHAAVFPAFYQFMIDNGIEQTWEDTRTSIKLHPEIDFTIEKFNALTNKHYPEVKSLAKASKEETSQFIDKVIRLADRWNLKVEDPEVYKQRMQIKNFTK